MSVHKPTDQTLWHIIYFPHKTSIRIYVCSNVQAVWQLGFGMTTAQFFRSSSQCVRTARLRAHQSLYTKTLTLHYMTSHSTKLALTQVALIAVVCCVGHICMVDGGCGCSCMLLLHPVPTSTDAGPNLFTLCPDFCTLHSDLGTLCL